MFLVLRLLASLFAPVPSRPNDATLRGADLEARHSQLTRDELDRELEHERRRRHALEAKAAEAVGSASRRNQEIRDVRALLLKCQADLRQAQAQASGHKGNAHDLSLRLAEAIKREAALREEPGAIREIIPGAKAVEADLRKELELERWRTNNASSEFHRVQGELADARRRVDHVYAGPGDVWRWQGDGTDRPESLACPVVMPAETLRGMLAVEADLRKELEATRYAAQDLERTAGELRTRNVEIQEDLDQARKSLEGLRVELEDTVDALEEVRADFLACAQAIGVVYEADGHPTHPGPVEEVVEHIREAARAQGQAAERLGLLEGLLASVRDRGEAVSAADGRTLYRLPPWLQERINATLERRDGRPGDDPDQERHLEDEIATLHAQPAIAAAWVLDRAEQLLGRLAQVLELEHPERATLGEVDQSSARRAWADTLIAGLRKGEHLEAYRAGELDDLCDVPRKVDGIAVSPDHGGKS